MFKKFYYFEVVFLQRVYKHKPINSAVVGSNSAKVFINNCAEWLEKQTNNAGKVVSQQLPYTTATFLMYRQSTIKNYLLVKQNTSW